MRELIISAVEAGDLWKLASLGVAVVGSLGGIVAFLEHRRKRPQLAVSDHGQITGDTTWEDGTKAAHVILILTLSTKSEAAVIPRDFEFRIRDGETWLPFRYFLIPEGLPLKSNVQEIDLGEFWKRDLLRCDAVRSDEPRRGYLMFLSMAISSAQLFELCRRKAEAELVCVDVQGKRHKHKFRMSSQPASEFTDPRHGYSVRRKNSDST